MTTLKVRGWDTVAKRMLSPDDLCELDIFLSPSGQGFFQKIGHRIIPFPTIIPLRFTGRVDKNGAEIYEGDVVQAENPFGSTPERIICYHIVDENCALKGKSMKSYKVEGKGDRWVSLCLSDAIEMATAEVIGNIYEENTK